MAHTVNFDKVLYLEIDEEYLALIIAGMPVKMFDWLLCLVAYQLIKLN